MFDVLGPAVIESSPWRARPNCSPLMTPSHRKRICLLGATGSIGESTLQVVADFPDRFEIVGLSAHTSAATLARLADELKPAAVCLSGSETPPGEAGGSASAWFSGEEGLAKLVEACEPDIVVVAIVGAAGLTPTLRALELGLPVALANKEVLVTAGALVMDLARRRGVQILPIDSEHNAIFQCLAGHADDPVRRVILTASGGPFRGRTRAELAGVTVAEALDHPTWQMGPKITIDSATLMNKGFEVIEGHHLFGLDVDRFEVVIHPESAVHSMVEFVDGSILAHLGVTNMYLPIAHVLAYPERLENSRFDALDFTRVASLTFEDYDREVFPCLGYAYEAARRGGTWPAALNAANEIAVERFLAGEIQFSGIPELIDAVLQAHDGVAHPGLDEIRRADAEAREKARENARSLGLSRK